jgi:hypothetical protein
MIRKMPGGLIVTWPARAESRFFGAWLGGYLSVAPLGLKILQRFHRWGVAAVGQQRELIARIELTLRPVTTAALLHLELFTPNEARLFLLQLKVWKGWDIFFIVNLGARLTRESQSVRAEKMREIMLQKAKREQAQRIQSRRIQQQIARQRQGNPWPTRAR